MWTRFPGGGWRRCLRVGLQNRAHGACCEWLVRAETTAGQLLAWGGHDECCFVDEDLAALRNELWRNPDRASR